MKKSFLLALSAIFMLASCTSEVEKPTPAAKDDAKLEIKFDAPAAAEQGKAFIGDTDVAITNAVAFVFTQEGNFIAGKYISDPSTATSINVTTAAKNVVVLANLGQTLSEQLIADVKNTTDLAAKYGSIENQHKQATMWMHGADNTFTFAKVGDDMKASAEITMTIIPAKFNVTVTNNMTNKGTVDEGKLNIVGIALLNSAAYTHYAPTFVPATSLITGTDKYYRSGLVSSPSTDITLWTGDDMLLMSKADGSAGVNGAENNFYKPWNGTGTFEETFYAFKGNHNLSPVGFTKSTIVTIHCQKKNLTTNKVEDHFFSAIFSADDVLASETYTDIRHGDRYAVALNLKVDAGTGGSTDPEVPVVKGILDVTVKPVAWNPVTISKDFE